MPPPEDKTQLKSFLGMVNYYHRHLKNMSIILEPLHELLRKDVKWHWDAAKQKSFDDIKRMLYSEPILIHYDPNKHIRITSDASPYGIGAVLSHVLEDGTEMPIAFTSRSLSKSERNFAQIEKETLAIVYAVSKFHQYIYGLEFEIITDHKPLLGIIGENKHLPAHSVSRIQRWALLLCGYNYKLLNKCGNDIPHADCLSRLPLDNVNDETSQIINTIHINHLRHSPVSSKEVAIYTRRDPVMSKIIDYLIMVGPIMSVSRKNSRCFSVV